MAAVGCGFTPHTRRLRELGRRVDAIAQPHTPRDGPVRTEPDEHVEEHGYGNGVEGPPTRDVIATKRLWGKSASHGKPRQLRDLVRARGLENNANGTTAATAAYSAPKGRISPRRVHGKLDTSVALAIVSASATNEVIWI